MAHMFSAVLESPVAARVNIGQLDSGIHYLSLSFNDGDLSLILPGDDAEAITAAREVAQALTDAANALERTLLLIRRSSAGDAAAEQDEADSRD